MVPDTITCELMSWEDFAVLARTLALRIKQSRFRPDLVIAIGRGGYVPARVVCDFLLHDMLTSIKVEHWGRAAEEKVSVNIRFPLSVDIKDQTVLVIDDVTDTGKTMDMAISYLRSLNPREIRTAVLQHKVSSPYRPDYFGREEQEWRWIIYPWAVHEDIVGFVEKILSRAPVDEKGIMTALRERYELHMPLSDIRDALEDLLDRGRITRSGTMYRLT
jgi:hypoxanthine phosphoribosyltransferase